MKEKKWIFCLLAASIVAGGVGLALHKDSTVANAAQEVIGTEPSGDLQENVTYNSDLYITQGLNLNGKTLTVNGNVEIASNVNLNLGTLIVNGNILHTNGWLNVGQGILQVSGDYRIQTPRISATGETEYLPSNGYLLMEESEGKVVIGGDFVIQSTNNRYFSAGTMEIGGDIIQKNGHAYNFSCSREHKIILTGNKEHRIEIESEYSGFAHLESEGKILWKGYMRINFLDSDLDVVAQKAEDGTELVLEAIGVNGKYLTIHGDVAAQQDITLSGGGLKIEGNVLQQSGRITVDTGELEITRDYRIQTYRILRDGSREYLQTSGGLWMNQPEGKVVIGGDFVMQSTGGWSFGAGTMEIGGNIIQKNGDRGNFNCNGDHRVILTGNKEHRVEIESDRSGFAHLESEGKILWKGYMRINFLDSNLEVEAQKAEDGSELALESIGVNGKYLTIHGDVAAQNDITLSGGGLKIEGNVLQPSGQITVGTGELEITGDYRIQNFRTLRDGSREYLQSNGTLVMAEPQDKVVIGGDFVIQSTSWYGYFRAGTMEIAGNVTQKNGNGGNFYCRDEHTVILNGTKAQKVEFESNDSGFANLIVTRALSTYTFSRTPCWVNLTESAVSIKECTIKNITKKAYTGKALTPALTITYNGVNLVQGTDYTVKYSNNKKTGRATVTINGIGAYTGTVEKTFDIVPVKVASVKATSSEAKTMTVTWKKDTTASGYIIEYSTDNSFKKSVGKVTIKTNATVSKEIGKLKSGKTYYVRIRAYKTINGKKAYGSYSSVVKVTVK